jgi:Xaa-Pro aminopeptidase
LKIIKNATEINGLKAALQTESCALVSFYSEVRERIQNGGFAEHEGELMLHNQRAKFGGDLYLGPSFPAIIGVDSNGAIVHYRPEKGSDKLCTSLAQNILIDTGAHYLNGTTDTTRTIVFSP